jgi:hypothetical protein
MPVKGTWNIGGYVPDDYGFTELLRELAGKRPSAEVTTNFNNPLVYGSQGISTAPSVGVKAGGGGGSWGDDTPSTTKSITSVPSGKSGGGDGGGDGGGGVDEVSLANAARQNRINSYKAQAGNLRSSGQSTFDNIIKSVNAFRDRSKGLYDTAGQEITNNASEILGSNARTAEEAAGEARSRGRAMGLGDSSKFNLQNKVQGNLASTQGNTIARRGEEESSNRNLFQERQDQAQGQEDEANTYIRGVNDRAASIENLGYDAGEEQFANSLNDIVNYQRSLAAIKPVQAEGLTQYAPDFSGIVNTINGVLSGLGGNTTTAGDEDFANPVNPTDVFSLLKRRGLVSG